MSETERITCNLKGQGIKQGSCRVKVDGNVSVFAPTEEDQKYLISHVDKGSY